MTNNRYQGILEVRDDVHDLVNLGIIQLGLPGQAVLVSQEPESEALQFYVLRIFVAWSIGVLWVYEVIGSDYNIWNSHSHDNDAHLAMAMDWQRVVPPYSSTGTCPNGRLGFSSGISSDKGN